ncbi:alpha/beta hydrolase [Streptomyces tricolor]|nr:alpha/beta hydrolase [Streptomyces tricolor]
MLVASAHDPVTPVAGAHALRRLLPGSRLVTLENDYSHGVFASRGNACVDDTAAAYLVDGTVPPADVRCAGPGLPWRAVTRGTARSAPSVLREVAQPAVRRTRRPRPGGRARGRRVQVPSARCRATACQGGGPGVGGRRGGGCRTWGRRRAGGGWTGVRRVGGARR